MLEAKPKESLEDNLNYGKIWIDKTDFSILKIEIDQESLAGFNEELKRAIKNKQIRPVLSTTHQYFIEKNGIRFPSTLTLI